MQSSPVPWLVSALGCCGPRSRDPHSGQQTTALSCRLQLTFPVGIHGFGWSPNRRQCGQQGGRSSGSGRSDGQIAPPRSSRKRTWARSLRLSPLIIAALAEENELSTRSTNLHWPFDACPDEQRREVELARHASKKTARRHASALAGAVPGPAARRPRRLLLFVERIQ